MWADLQKITETPYYAPTCLERDTATGYSRLNRILRQVTAGCSNHSNRENQGSNDACQIYEKFLSLIKPVQPIAGFFLKPIVAAVLFGHGSTCYRIYFYFLKNNSWLRCLIEMVSAVTAWFHPKSLGISQYAPIAYEIVYADT